MKFETIIVSAVLFGFLFALYCVVGEMDYQDEKQEEKSSAAEYCWRVQAGAHRDWNTNIDCPAMPRQVAGIEHE